MPETVETEEMALEAQPEQMGGDLTYRIVGLEIVDVQARTVRKVLWAVQLGTAVTQVEVVTGVSSSSQWALVTKESLQRLMQELLEFQGVLALQASAEPVVKEVTGIYVAEAGEMAQQGQPGTRVAMAYRLRQGSQGKFLDSTDRAKIVTTKIATSPEFKLNPALDRSVVVIHSIHRETGVAA